MGKAFKPDEIGLWSEAKLDIIKEYASRYTEILSKQSFIRKIIYIDAFSGSGIHISRTTRDFVKGSPLNALNVEPPFNEFHFIDMDGDKASELRNLVGSHNNINIYQGDANELLTKEVFPKCRYEDYNRALCLLDPYSLNVDWNVILAAGQRGTIEIFYNFMIMDVNMNILKHNRDNVDTTQAERMDRAWGDRTWEEFAYRKNPTLFGYTVDQKLGNKAIAEAFRHRLQKVAGFKFVPEPIPMRNENNATIYYLYFASPNNTGEKIVKHIFDKYRTQGAV
jgi:three-Cys-motif partner protein